MGQRPQIKRDPNFRAHLGDRLLRVRPLTGKPPPPPPEASQLADDHHAITVSMAQSLGIDTSSNPAKARVANIDNVFRQLVGL